MPIDYREYPLNWKTEIRPAVMRRAGELRGANGQIVVHARCEGCGVLNHTMVERPGKLVMVVLTVAHLDHDKGNNEVSIDRLRAWCQRCHLNYDRPRHMENRRRNAAQKKLLQYLF